MTEVAPQQPGYAHAYQRLIDLGPERLTQLEGRMAKAEPSHMLADIIQQEWGLCKDVERRTLARQISRYRNQMVTPKMAALYEAGQGGEKAEKALKVLYNQCNVLEELHDLYETQKQRIQKAVQNESKLPVLLKDVDFQIDTARKILADMAHVQLEVGILRRAVKGVQGTIQNPDGTKSSFAYVVGEAEAASLERDTQDFVDFIDGELGYVEATVPADAPAVGHAAAGDQRSSQS